MEFSRRTAREKKDKRNFDEGGSRLCRATRKRNELICFFASCVLAQAMERHQGFLTAPNDIPLPLTPSEMAIMARYKPVAPQANTVPMPKNPDWINLPFRDVRELGNVRRIILIDYVFERAANEAVRLKEYFGCLRWPI